MKMEYFIDKQISSIQSMHGNFVLSHYTLSMDEVDYCAEMLACYPSLNGVFFNNCQLGPKKIMRLLPIMQNPNLKRISLTGNDIDDSTVLELVSLLIKGASGDLEYLYLSNNPDIGELGISALTLLKAARPELEIEGVKLPGTISAGEMEKESYQEIRLRKKLPLHEVDVRDLIRNMRRPKHSST